MDGHTVKKKIPMYECIGHQNLRGRPPSFTSPTTIKAALADRKKVIKTGSIFMGRGRCMGRGSAEASCRGMDRGSARVRLRVWAGAVLGHVRVIKETE